MEWFQAPSSSTHHFLLYYTSLTLFSETCLHTVFYISYVPYPEPKKPFLVQCSPLSLRQHFAKLIPLSTCWRTRGGAVINQCGFSTDSKCDYRTIMLISSVFILRAMGSHKRALSWGSKGGVGGKGSHDHIWGLRRPLWPQIGELTGNEVGWGRQVTLKEAIRRLWQSKLEMEVSWRRWCWIWRGMEKSGAV